MGQTQTSLFGTGMIKKLEYVTLGYVNYTEYTIEETNNTSQMR